MKTTKVSIIAILISLTLNSCFLFRPKHESCPAYGENSEQQDNNIENIKLNKSKDIKEA